ncbi:MAG: DUF4411 family protein [Candidatus Portiera sp.]|nr:DUF4411 family protein [Portiera sp.]
MTYLIDASSLMQSQRVRYPLQNFPGVWDFLHELHKKDKLFSIDKVKDEINDGDEHDELKKWVNNPKLNKFFTSANFVNLQDNIRIIENGLASKNYDPSAIFDFLKGTDCYLVAYAMRASATEKIDYIVITEEVASNSTMKIKIPDVCKIADTEYNSFIGLIKKENPKFVLHKSGIVG